MSVGFARSYAVVKPSALAAPSPSSSVASTSGRSQTAGSNTAAHAVANDIGNVPKRTCTSPARTVSATETAQKPTSIGSSQPSRLREATLSVSAATPNSLRVHLEFRPA
jgi:hypothetical protein